MGMYDYVMIVVLIGATIIGAWKGLAWQVASLASLVVSYFVALQYSPTLAPHLPAEAPFNRFLAMLILYAASSVAIWWIFRLVAGVIDRVRLKEFDRQMGALMGAAKGVLLCVAITFFAVSMTSDSWRDEIINSKSGYYIAKLIDRAKPVMPDEIQRVIGPHLDKLDAEIPHDHVDYGEGTDGHSHEHASDEMGAESQTPRPASIDGWLPKGATSPDTGNPGF